LPERDATYTLFEKENASMLYPDMTLFLVLPKTKALKN